LSTVEADLHRGDDLDPSGRSQKFGPRKGGCFGLTRGDIDLEAHPAVLRVRRDRVETRSGALIFQEPKTAVGRRSLS